MEIAIDRTSIEESTKGATILVVVDGVNQFVEIRHATILGSCPTQADFDRSSAQLLTLHLATFEDAIRQYFRDGPTVPANMVAVTF